MSLNLKDMTRHLFVSCLSQSEALGSQSHHEFLLGVSFLAMMFNAGFVIRMLAMSLVRCVYAGDAAAQAAVDRLADAEQWALDEELMLVCNDLMAVAQTSGDFAVMGLYLYVNLVSSCHAHFYQGRGACPGPSSLHEVRGTPPLRRTTPVNARAVCASSSCL